MTLIARFEAEGRARLINLTGDVSIVREDEKTPGAPTEVRVNTSDEAYLMILARDMMVLLDVPVYSLSIDRNIDNDDISRLIYNGRAIDNFEQELQSNQLKITV